MLTSTFAFNILNTKYRKIRNSTSIEFGIVFRDMIFRVVRFLSSASSKSAFVFDIDGVLIRGNKPIPQAKTALDLLTQEKVPFLLLTNGGGVTEKKRAEFLSDKLGVELSPNQLVQSHTPLKILGEKHAYDRILVVGGINDEARKCALEYGFQDVIVPMDIVKQNPSVSPHHRYTPEQLSTYARDVDLLKPIEAIAVFNDPRDMGTDVQVTLDLLNSVGGLLGTKRKVPSVHRSTPLIPIIFSNDDFIWANDYPIPRFGQGAFRMVVETLYKKVNNCSEMDSLILGKPYAIQYDYAKKALAKWHTELLHKDSAGHIHSPGAFAQELKEPVELQFDRIYMVGDNPASDIKGANDNGWDSMLVRTGVYHDEPLDSLVALPTAGVHDDVLEAVKYGLNQK